MLSYLVANPSVTASSDVSPDPEQTSGDLHNGKATL